uniref:Geranylgeranylglyceryl phosphate synthase n=1 Tax=Candidatus Methanophagaceae archaeon ANME-1 ERB6 TaxID=2759912 RepID=A0A7G9YUZ4_9EURY|nr:geranylgeranylglyceryl phosphate synthase [Methanosarcinales archaeon ANME-1 ERB6]QNO51828.1 geranylgeranylglyceryl phosphate synthase [Methanosarcinales archaeon ANME-1 ERB6]
MNFFTLFFLLIHHSFYTRRLILKAMTAKETPWKNWNHITKLDPDKHISRDDLKTVVESGTDAIMISGTQNITNRNVTKLIAMVNDYDIPKILEPATPGAVMYEGIDYVFVPLVLNSRDLEWIVGKHVDWIKKQPIEWDMITSEAYIVLNPESAVAKLTKSDTDLTDNEVVAYARYAEKYLHLPITYIEYSGTYGEPDMVKKVKQSLTETSLFYGGGIDSKEKAAEMAACADVIVVGNVVYTDIEKFLATII